MAAGLVPRIIVLALGAGALGFPDVLCVLMDTAGRSPLTDIAICFLAMAVVTTQALGAMLLARFIRKTAPRAGVDAHARVAPPRTDRFARMTLVVSLGVTFLVSACLLVASGAGARGIGLLCLVSANVAAKMKSPVIAALATAAFLPCARLLRVLRQEEDQSHGPVAAAGTGRFARLAQVASFTGAAAFLIVVSGNLCAQRGSLVGVAAVVGTVLLARFTYARRARRAASAGGRAAAASIAGTRRVGDSAAS